MSCVVGRFAGRLDFRIREGDTLSEGPSRSHEWPIGTLLR